MTVDPKNSDVIWLGTGENQSQRAIGWGDGVYKSVDAGKTWKNVGLKHSEHIAKILVDPRDSNVVYVASQGPLFSPGGDRGLYKTTDGGETWKPLLQITENTGITDIDIDPRNPDVMYAAAYQRRRNTSVIVAGGPEAGIFKTTDGGTHWKKLTEGLPKVDMGRIALAVSPQKPDVVYALIMTARGNKHVRLSTAPRMAASIGRGERIAKCRIRNITARSSPIPSSSTACTPWTSTSS